jgi:uncharacterized protein YjcR
MSGAEKMVNDAVAILGTFNQLLPELQSAIHLTKCREVELDGMVGRIQELSRTAELTKRKYVSEAEAVELGYFSSKYEARKLRRESRGPEFIQEEEGCRVRYPVAELEIWLNRNRRKTMDTLERKS